MNLKCPHGCKDKAWNDFDSIDGERQTPKDGDVVVCFTCGGWWILTKNEFKPYTPTMEELKEVQSIYALSQVRSRQAYKNNKAIKPS